MVLIPEYKDPGMLINRDGARTEFHDSCSAFTQKIRGIEEQVKKGRYGKHALKRGGKKKLVNYYVYYDYTIYQCELEEKNMAKYVPPFDATEIMSMTPRHRIYVYDDE